MQGFVSGWLLFSLLFFFFIELNTIHAKQIQYQKAANIYEVTTYH